MASIFEKVSEKSKKNTATLFKDLNKPTKDLFEKGFKTDIYEVETETTTPNGIKLKTVASKKSDGVFGSIEGPSYTWKDWGLNLKFTGKTTDKGHFTVEGSVEDKGVEGLKVSVNAESKGDDRSVKATAEYKHQYTALSLALLYPITEHNPSINANGVFKYENAVLAGDLTYNLGEKPDITSHSYRLQFEHQGFLFGLYCNKKGSDPIVAGIGVHDKVKDGIEIAADLSVKHFTSDPKLSLVGLYQLDKATTLKGKFDSKGRIGLSYKQKVSDAATVTFAADLDGNNLQSNSGHKFGVHLLLTPQ